MPKRTSWSCVPGTRKNRLPLTANTINALCQPVPKPIQKPNPPIYIPGGGSVETWDFCLDNDYNYSYLSFTGYLRGKKLLDGYWDRVAARGKDESPYRAAFAQTICVAIPTSRPKRCTPST